MKFSFVVVTALLLGVILTIGTANAYDNDFMKGVPNINPNYYNYSQSYQPSGPNYDSDFYDKRPDRNVYGYRNDSTFNDAPHGNDIRDYNPYYDRYGNLIK